MTDDKKKRGVSNQLVAGGVAGFVESTVCHPLDTIKTRMQLRRQQTNMDAIRARSSIHEPSVTKGLSSLAEPRLALSRQAEAAADRTNLSNKGATSSVVGNINLALSRLHEPGLRVVGVSGVEKLDSSSSALPEKPTKPRHVPLVAASLGPIGTARRIVEREGFFSLYKGLTAVYSGIIPKMAIRFVSFEQYRENLQRFFVGTSTTTGQYNSSVNFFAGLLSGLTEAVIIVTPAEVCKIRMQAQYNSLVDPTQVAHRKYTNVFQTAFTIVKEEGFGALYKGVVPTMLRQGCNQAVNFSTYNWLKKVILDFQEDQDENKRNELKHWQSLLLGGISGGLGPLINNPLDVVKTRTQKQVIIPGKEPKYKGIIQSCRVIANEEGAVALWRGITPRLLRIMPGQAITFMTYEAVSTALNRQGF